MTVRPSIELSLLGVSSGYSGTTVLEDFDLSIKEGERLGLIGRNGAGKTTALATIMGIAELHRGRVELDGRDISRRPTWQRARLGLGLVPQTRDVFPSLTVHENLVSAISRREHLRNVELAYQLFPRLSERRRNYGDQLSGGEQQMLSVARSLVPGPRFLLLDEPLEGLAPQVRDELMDAIKQLTDETGVGSILVEQHVDVVLDFASRVFVLERGVVVFTGSTEELKERPDVLNRAIGLEKAAPGG
jgi:branched-chain amino acid transport system ATP-binding protein